MENDEKVGNGGVLSPSEIVNGFWEAGIEADAMPASIRALEASNEEVVAEFKEWYECYQQVLREDEDKNPSEAVNVFPPEGLVIATLLEDYAKRLDAKAAKYRARCMQFESVARPKWGQDVIYREGNTLFVAKLLRTEVVGDRVDIFLRIIPIEDLTFAPVRFACDVTQQGDLIINTRWQSFWFSEFRWFEAQIGWNIYFSHAIITRLISETKALANAPRKEKFSRLAAVLIEEVCKRGIKYHPDVLPWLVKAEK